MKIPSSTLKNIAVSAGISATAITTASAANAITPAKPGSGKGCVVIPAQVNAKRVAPVKQKTAKEIFAEADKNKDGKLSQDEFNKAFSAIVAQEKAKQVVKPKLPVMPHGPGNGCPGCGLG